MKLRRLWAMLIVAALCFRPVAAVAAGSFDDYAAELKRLGLFQGTDSGFELERAPSRTEAIVMLIRLLGKEDAALAATPPAEGPGHPFTDVPAWADPYVAYAFQNGLTKGVAPSLFGAADTVTAPQYFTLILRSLGYSDAAGDFEWSKAVEKASSVGIVTSVDYLQADSVFLRGNLVDVSYGALGANLKGEETTLLQKLVAAGAVAADLVGPTGPPARMEGTKLIVPLRAVPDRVGEYAFDLTSITEVLPGARLLTNSEWLGSYSRDLTPQEVYLLNIVRPVLSQENTWVLRERQWIPTVPKQDFDHQYYLLDSDFNLLAYATTANLSLSDDTSELAMETSIDFDCPTLMSDTLTQAKELSSRACAFSNDLFVPSTYTWFGMLPGESTPTAHDIATMVVNRAGLPAYAQGFTRATSIAYYQPSPEELALLGPGYTPVTSIEQVDMPKSLLHNRIVYLTTPHRERYYRSEEYDDQTGFPVNRLESMWQISLYIVLLQDDSGAILGYIAFTAADLERIATE